jgi:hypothetical protein
MDILSSIWHVGAGIIVGLSLALGAWSAGAWSDHRRSPPEDIAQDAGAVTPRTHRTAHSAPTPKA